MTTLRQIKACLTTHTHYKPVFFLGVVFILLLLLPSPVSAAERVYNGDFSLYESGQYAYVPSGWVVGYAVYNGWDDGYPSICFDSGYYYTYPSVNFYGGAYDGSSISQSVDLSGCDDLTFYARGFTSAPEGTLVVKIDGIQVFSKSVPSMGNDFVLYTVDVSSYDGYHTIGFYGYGVGSSASYGDCFWIDDVSVIGPDDPLVVFDYYIDENSGLLSIMWDRSSFDLETYEGLMITPYIREYSDSGKVKYVNGVGTNAGSLTCYYYDDPTHYAEFNLTYYYNGANVDYTIATASYNMTWNGSTNPDSPSTPPEPGDEDEFQDEDIPPYDIPDHPDPLNPLDDPDYNDDPGEGEGNYPMELPGNVSINATGLGSYYAYVDSVFAPVNNTVMGVTTFVLKPVTSLSGYIGEVNGQFQEITETTVNTGFMVEVINPITHALPSKVQMLFTYAILLIIIRLVLQG